MFSSGHFDGLKGMVTAPDRNWPSIDPGPPPMVMDLRNHYQSGFGGFGRGGHAVRGDMAGEDPAMAAISGPHMRTYFQGEQNRFPRIERVAHELVQSRG